MSRLKIFGRFAVLAVAAAALVAVPAYLAAGSALAQGGDVVTLSPVVTLAQRTPGVVVGSITLPDSLGDSDVDRPSARRQSFALGLPSHFERWELIRTVDLGNDVTGTEVVDRGEDTGFVYPADEFVVPGFDYDYYAKAYQADGEVVESNTVEFDDVAYRAALSGIPVNGGVKLVIKDAPSGATGYTVYRYDPTSDAETPSFEEVTLNANDVDTGVVSKQYYMYVVEHTGPDTGGDGVEVLSTTNTVVVKAGVDGRTAYLWDVQVQSDENAGTMTVKWSGTLINRGAFPFYEIRRRVNSPQGDWETLNVVGNRSNDDYRVFVDDTASVDVFYDFSVWSRDYLGKRTRMGSFVQKEKIYTVPTCVTDHSSSKQHALVSDGTHPISGYLMQSGSWYSEDHRVAIPNGAYEVNPHAVQGKMTGTQDGNVRTLIGDPTRLCQGAIDLDGFEVERTLLSKFVEADTCGDDEWCFVVGGDSGVAGTPAIVEPTDRVLTDLGSFVFITADPEYPDPGIYQYGYRVCTAESGDDKVCSSQLVAPEVRHQFP